MIYISSSFRSMKGGQATVIVSSHHMGFRVHFLTHKFLIHHGLTQLPRIIFQLRITGQTKPWLPDCHRILFLTYAFLLTYLPYEIIEPVFYPLGCFIRLHNVHLLVQHYLEFPQVHLKLIHRHQEIVVGDDLTLYFLDGGQKFLPNLEDFLRQLFPILFGLVWLDDESSCLVVPCVDAVHQLIELLLECLMLLFQFKELFFQFFLALFGSGKIATHSYPHSQMLQLLCLFLGCLSVILVVLFVYLLKDGEVLPFQIIHFLENLDYFVFVVGPVGFHRLVEDSAVGIVGGFGLLRWFRLLIFQEIFSQDVLVGLALLETFQVFSQLEKFDFGVFALLLDFFIEFREFVVDGEKFTRKVLSQLAQIF